VAKTRAQRKAERRRREAQQGTDPGDQVAAQRRTQVPESADVVEAELAEAGADLDALREEPAAEPPVEEIPAAPAPSRADVGAPPESAPAGRRERKQQERERQRRAKESERRRQARAEPQERQRGAVIGFFVSCWAELKRVQWPDRETLIQASAVTLLFIAIAAAYLGALDAIFNWIVQRVL
jgi:preprotein translocase SecE subunit